MYDFFLDISLSAPAATERVGWAPNCAGERLQSREPHMCVPWMSCVGVAAVLMLLLCFCCCCWLVSTLATGNWKLATESWQRATGGLALTESGAAMTNVNDLPRDMQST